MRRDPRCTLFVFDPPMRWRALETTVTLLEGPDAPGLHPRLSAPSWAWARADHPWGSRQATDEEIIAMTGAEQRLIYDFEIHKAYGQATP